ncbi:fibronectin type III domain-containing protein [Actinosynnema sp. NPDC020468]|uniref:DUF7927 domain-containing protein n=1 Tax=Actinosynnema sp. NPDC020468 TaxID=3154488 RepID=UPI0033EA133E
MRRALPLAVVITLLAAVTSVVTPGTARAAGTTLFDNSFANSTVNGTGTVTVPTPVSGVNAACLTAVGNLTTGPLLSCVGTTDTAGNGKLRFTSAVATQIGGVYGKTSFPTSNGLDISFNSYQYGGSGADGISFVLAAVDPANPAPPTAIGPQGGSLGYSTSSGLVGLTNGYLGIGLDVYGNYSSPSFQGSGCTSVPSTISAAVAGAIVVRGPGNGTVGYCGLTTTYSGTAASKLTLKAATRAASVVPVQVLINPTTLTYTSPSGVSVSGGTYKVVATPVGGTAKTLSGTLPSVSSSLYPSASYLNASGVPKQLAFGFIGSTGGVTDVHEIGNVKALTFNPVPQLAIDTTSYAQATVTAGGPVTYKVTPSVLAGADETQAVSVTQTVPTGVAPQGAYGTGWVCATPVGQSVTCTTSATSFANGTTLPDITVVGIATTTITAATVQSGSPTTVSSADGNPATDSATTAGTLPATPTVTAVTPSAGSTAGGGAVTVTGTNLGTATAIEIGTTTEQQGGTPVTLFPCVGTATTNCFTITSGTTLVIPSMPGRSSAAQVTVTAVTQGLAASAPYTYASAPATPAAPTATAGITSATVTWTAPAANGSPITGYTVTPYRDGVAQTPVTYSGTATSQTLTGLTAGATYTFTVAATNAYGTSAAGAKSNAVVPYTVPTAPTITAASAGDSAATLTWSAPSSNGGSAITGYVVTPYVNGVAQAPQTFSGTTTTQTITGLTPGTAYTFTVAAQNAAGTGPPSAQSPTVTPNFSPSLTFPAPPSGEVGVAYSTQFTVTGGTAPFTWSVSAGSLPPGLALNPGTGVLSGTPTTAGSYTFTVQVVDASGQSATKQVTVVIAAQPVAAFTPPAGEVGAAYSAQATVTGGTAPYTWAVTAGSLPPGLTLNTSTGLVSGTPTAAGSYPVTLQVTDAFNQTSGKTATITIAAKPAFGTTPPPSGQVGVPYSTTFDVTGGTAPFAYAVTAGSLPPGLTLNPATGQLVGTPTAAGTYAFTVQVTDSFNQTATKSVSVTVNPGPLVITKSATTSSAAPGATVGYTITVANTGAVAFPVQLSDPLAGVVDDATYRNDATATTGTLTYSSSTLGWSGTVAAGATATITYSVAVNNPTTGNKVLTNTVTSSTLGTNCPSGGTDARCSSTVTVPGLTITKTADTATTTPGGTVRFTITATNSGQTAFPAATITDSLAGVLDDAVYDGNGTASSGAVQVTGSTLTWTGALAVGATVTITYTATVNDPDTGDRSLTGTVVSPTAGSSCPSGGTAAQCTATVTVLVPALSITHTANTSTTTPGGTVGYTTTIANTGQTAYRGITVTTALAGALDDATYNNDATATGGTVSYAAPNLTWTGDLAAGASVTVTGSVTVRNPDPGDKTLTTVASSSASGSTCPPGSTSGACTATVQVRVPQLTIAKTADVATTTPGSVVKYTVTVTNTGQTAYPSATVSDPLAGILDDATYLGDAATTSGTVSYTNSTITWLGTLAVGASATVTYSVRVKDPDTGDRSLTGTVVSTNAGSSCPQGGTDSRCTSTVAVLVPALSFAVTADKATATPGQTVGYTAKVTNTGQTTYGPVTVTLDPRGVYDDATSDNNATVSTGTLVTNADGTLTWTLSLAPGASATTTLSATVNNPVTGDKALRLTASSTAPGSTCPPGSTGSSCGTTVPVLVPGLTITKTASASAVTPGDRVTYTIAVVNNGETTQSPATFTDDLSTVLTDAVYSANATATRGTVSYSAPVLSWSGTLTPGQTATISYDVVVRDPDPGDKRLLNTVVSGSPGSNCPQGGTDTRCTAAVSVQVPGLTISTTTDKSTATPGAVIVRTLTITNSGATPYTGATVTEAFAGVLDDADVTAGPTADRGTVTLTGGTLKWTGDLAVGATATVTTSVTVHAADTGDDLVTGTVTSTARGANCVSGTGDARCTSTVPVARLVLQQSYADSTTTPGAVVRLTATFTNTGQVPQTGVTVTSPSAGTVDDAVPNGDETASSGTLALTSTAITWTGSIPVGGTVTVTGTLTVKNPDTGDKVLTGTLQSTAPGNNCPSGTTDTRCTAKTTVLVPGLTVTTSANATSVAPGGTVGYTITIANTGQTPQTGITVTDALAGLLDDATYDGNATATSGSVSYTSPTLTWTGTLAAGATATVTFSATAKSPPTGDKSMITSVASAAVGSTCPPGGGASICGTTTTVLTPGLTIVKTANVPTATLGSDVTWTIKVTNSGQTPYAAATFADPLTAVLDDATYNNNATATAGTVGYANSTVSWTGALAVGASATITYTGTVRSPSTGDRTMTNTVTSTSVGSNCASGSGDSRCTATVSVLNSVTLTFVKTADVSYTTVGAKVNYTITATNSGVLPVLLANYTDNLAGVLDDATYNNDAVASIGVVTYTAQGVVWNGSVAGGGTATVTYSVTTTGAGDKVLNSNVNAGSLLTSNNCNAGAQDARCFSSIPVASLVLQQAYAQTSTTPGSIATLTATFTNTGKYAYTGITISSPTTDTFDDAVPYGEQTASSGSLVLTSTSITWTGSIPVGGTVTVTGKVQVRDPDTGNRLLKGTLQSTAPGNNCPSGTTDARCTASLPVLLPALTITKSANATFVVPGGTVGYTITIANTGETPYTGATVVDALAGLLDDATYDANAVATRGAVSYTAPSLTWTGDLAVGAQAVVTYTATARRPATGDKTMVDTVGSTDAGSTCPPASGNAACRTTVAVLTPALTFTSSADQTSTAPGRRVVFTVTATNTGQTAYTGATFRVPLADVLDDAALDGAPTATGGTVAVAGTDLTWTGSLAVGASTTITYAVVVANPVSGDYDLDQVVVSAEQGSTCPAGGTDPRCAVTVPIAGIRITNTAGVTTAKPTDVVPYTVVIENVGKVALNGVTADALFAGALDDATYNGDATTTIGSLVIVPAEARISFTGDLAVGARAVITGSVTVDNPPRGDKVLTTVVTSSVAGGNCPVGGTNPVCRTSVRVLTPGLTVTKTADRTAAAPGALVGYTVTIANTGETAYQGAVVRDSLEGVLNDAEYVGGTTTSGAVNYAAPVLTWTGDLGLGQRAVVSYQVRVRDPDYGNHQMVNEVSSAELGSSCPPAAPCTATVDVLVPALAVAVTADTTTTTPGSTVGYTVTIRNTGQTPYTAATVTTSLAGVVDDAAYPGGATATAGAVAYSGTNLTWTGDLAVGAQAVVTYRVVVSDPDAGDRSLVTSVSSAATGSTCGVGSPCVNTVRVLIPGLRVTTSADPTTTTPGSRVSFTTTVTNTGQTPYTGVTVTTDLAAALDDATFDGRVTASSGTATYAAPAVSWVGDVAVGATVTITWSVVVSDPDNGDRRLVATSASSAPGSTCRPGGTDPSCSVTVVVLVPALSIAKTTSTPTTTPGSVVGYRIVVTNTGQTTYSAATVTDSLTGLLGEAAYRGDAAVVGGGVVGYADSTVTWTGSLPQGAAAVITYSVLVNSPATGDRQLTNGVVSDDPGSTCPSGGTAAACSTLVPVLIPGLTLAKSADTTTAVAGQAVRYTVVVTNSGQTPYAPARFTDSLAGVLDDAVYNNDATATVGQVEVVGGVLSWTGPLAKGDTATVTYSVTTRFPATGDRVLANSVSSTSPGADCGDGSRCRTSVPVLVPRLEITKTADRAQVVAGGTLAYTITAVNTGEAALPAATLTDSLAGVLDDASYRGDVTASSGSVSYSDGVVSWTGPLARGSWVVIGYSVAVPVSATGDGVLVNRVTSTTTGNTCPCSTSTPIAARTIALTGLAQSFTLSGLPNSAVSADGIVTMTVTTNSTTGYVVTVRATGPALNAVTPGNGASIPVERLAVRESGTTAFQPLSVTDPRLVHRQNAPSSPGGDAVSNDYRVDIPLVPSDTYTTTLEYIASAQ